MEAYDKDGLKERVVGKGQGKIPQANDFKSVAQVTAYGHFAHSRFLATETLLVSFAFHSSSSVQAHEHGHFWDR
jgi:hypothetical protein